MEAVAEDREGKEEIIEEECTERQRIVEYECWDPFGKCHTLLHQACTPFQRGKESARCCPDEREKEEDEEARRDEECREWYDKERRPEEGQRTLTEEIEAQR